MKVDFLKRKGTWRSIVNAARTTMGKEAKPVTNFYRKELFSDWKKRILLAEHSPIRKLIICWKWTDLKYWISVHFVRHKIGIEHWVESQRPDKVGNKDNRDNAPQNTLIQHECEANAQAIINISRKRLCKKAMPETREAWIEVIKKIRNIEQELAEICVPDCIYRGWCYEFNSCGWHLTQAFKRELNKYRNNINNWENKGEN